MTTKIVNYTPEQTAKAVADYKAGLTVEAIAAEFGKTTRSIIAKLSREGVYQKKEYVAKDGKTVVSKAELVKQIANKIGVEVSALSSLESTTKATLKMLVEAV